MVDRIKKGFEKTLSKFWPKLDLRVSAKSGKVNFEKVTITVVAEKSSKQSQSVFKLLHSYELTN